MAPPAAPQIVGVPPAPQIVGVPPPLTARRGAALGPPTDIHVAMQNLPQNPNASLGAHMNNTPLNRVRGRAAHGTVQDQNLDLASYLDRNAARHAYLQAQSEEDKKNRANSVVSKSKELESLAKVASIDILGEDIQNRFKRQIRQEAEALLTKMENKRQRTE